MNEQIAEGGDLEKRREILQQQWTKAVEKIDGDIASLKMLDKEQKLSVTWLAPVNSGEEGNVNHDDDRETVEVEETVGQLLEILEDRKRRASPDAIEKEVEGDWNKIGDYEKLLHNRLEIDYPKWKKVD